MFNIDDYVRLTRGRSGHIKWKGKLKSDNANNDNNGNNNNNNNNSSSNSSINNNIIHYGIELDEPDTIHGHNGEYNGIRYFTTNDMCGVIVPETHIIRKIRKKTNPIISKSRSLNEMANGSPIFGTNSSLISSLQHSMTGASNSSQTKAAKMIGMSNDHLSTIMTVEESIFTDIKNMILSNEKIEGRYRQDFFNKFPKYMKEDPENILHTVREWMDAIKKKIASKHGEKYKKRLKSAWQKHRKLLIKNSTSKATGDDKFDSAIEMIDEKLDAQTQNDSNANNGNGSNNNGSNSNGNKGNNSGSQSSPGTLRSDKSIQEMNNTMEQSQINEAINRLIESAVEQTVLQPKIKDLMQFCIKNNENELK